MGDAFYQSLQQFKTKLEVFEDLMYTDPFNPQLPNYRYYPLNSHGIPGICIELPTAAKTALSALTCKEEARIIQKFIKNLLRSDQVMGVPYSSCDGNIPIIILYCIDDDGENRRFYFHWVEKVDEAKRYEFLHNKTPTRPHQNSTTCKSNEIGSIAPSVNRGSDRGQEKAQVNILLFINKYLLDMNVDLIKYESLNIDTHPHTLFVGATGTGKSYAMNLMMGQVARYLRNISLIVCDFKNMSFPDLFGKNGYYGYHEVLQGIDTVYEAFQRRLTEGLKSRDKRLILVIDEYAAFLNSLEKKETDEVKKKIGTMLMMGRSMKIHLVLGIQRADAEFFKSGSRDQISSIVMLGNLSKEQKQMLVPDFKDEMIPISSRGQGYWYLDGLPLRNIVVPTIKDTFVMNQKIIEVLGV